MRNSAQRTTKEDSGRNYFLDQMVRAGAAKLVVADEPCCPKPCLGLPSPGRRPAKRGGRCAVALWAGGLQQGEEGIGVGWTRRVCRPGREHASVGMRNDVQLRCYIRYFCYSGPI